MFVMWFASCATAPEADVAQPEPIKEEKAQKPVVVIETVYLVSEEQSWFADGVADERRVNRYDEATTNKLESQLYDAEQKLQERTIYEWKEGLLLSERTENGAGEATSTHRYEYGNSLLVEDRLFDQNDELQTRLHWDYDAEGRKYGGRSTTVAVHCLPIHSFTMKAADSAAPRITILQVVLKSYSKVNMRMVFL